MSRPIIVKPTAPVGEVIDWKLVEEHFANAQPAGYWLHALDHSVATGTPSVETDHHLETAGDNSMNLLLTSDVDGNQQYVIETVENLDEYPQQSVGIIVAEFESEIDNLVRTQCSTGFYIGNGQVITVAHAFSLHLNPPVSGYHFYRGFFIPAYNKTHGLESQKYGTYMIEKAQIHFHSAYMSDKWNPAHDMAYVTLVRDVHDGKLIDNVGLAPIPLGTFDNSDTKTIWTVFGFHGRIMKRISGEKVPDSELNEILQSIHHNNEKIDIKPSEVLAIKTHDQILRGMSGGPFIWNHDVIVANGCQSCSYPKKCKGHWVAFATPHFDS